MMLNKKSHNLRLVMPGLDPGIHDLTADEQQRQWMAGTSPAMTLEASYANGNNF